jgi:hypothetical protein
MTTIYLVYCEDAEGHVIACPTHAEARKLSATLRTGRKIPASGNGSIREVLIAEGLGKRELLCAMFNRRGYANNPAPGEQQATTAEDVSIEDLL